MLFRFSLYGFLKNQRYFEAFFVLAFMEKGLGFFEIGLLVALRELTVIVLEVPSGAIADVCGRRASMVFGFTAYVVSFLVLGVAEGAGLLALGMVLLGVGDGFRTGTHKAMIFAWLRLQGRENERVEVYGYTRSWSKIGSALSVVVAALIVVTTDSYVNVFYLTAVPYAVSIVNLLGYPRELDERSPGRRSGRVVARHLVESVRTALSKRGLRRLVLETMGFDGVFSSVKDYLQPILAVAAIGGIGTLPFLAGSTETQRTAVLIAPVYVVLYLLSALASRRAHLVARAAGNEDRAARWIWAALAVLFAAMLAAAWFSVVAVMVLLFVALHVLQNVWHPLLISRFDRGGRKEHAASLLSIESMARRTAVALVAPPLGWAVDAATRSAGPGGDYWPIGAVGLVVALVYAGTGGRDSTRSRR